MKHSLVLCASSILFACGGGDGDGGEGNSSANGTANPIDEAADTMHNSLDKANEVEAMLEEQKKAIDDALEEAEAADPD